MVAIDSFFALNLKSQIIHYSELLIVVNNAINKIISGKEGVEQSRLPGHHEIMIPTGAANA